MSSVAIIPARGGSVRVPLKNIVEICGKPAVAYPIEVCVESGVFDEVIVSTDHSEIAQIAENYGASVHKRSPELSDSVAKVRDVVVDVLENKECELGCIVYPTAILIQVDDIQASHAMIDNDAALDFVLGASAMHPHPYKALKQTSAGCRPVFGEKIDMKGQEQPAYFAPNGTLHWFRRGAFLQQSDYWQANRALYPMSKLRSFDMDEPEDVEIIRAIKRYQIETAS
ncbi:acylneuraminate cytidylyltransferase family protein [Ruegeria conchae]|uniref:acylneuraminate cytidylyltransferase family protein n=1 Tax=Ruegeria conchae TaxID=981384 RepID=UPI0021A94981|nr:acylneuraminate cytidylyltransferase family protein [Ruegeria conchae]UWR01967.1 acylneuraminate cytidylyltransferase family protein [Ruegeria conchae]